MTDYLSILEPWAIYGGLGAVALGALAGVVIADSIAGLLLGVLAGCGVAAGLALYSIQRDPSRAAGEAGKAFGVRLASLF